MRTPSRVLAWFFCHQFHQADAWISSNHSKVAPLGLEFWVIGTVIIMTVAVSSAPQKFQQNPTTGSLVSAFCIFQTLTLLFPKPCFRNRILWPTNQLTIKQRSIADRAPGQIERKSSGSKINHGQWSIDKVQNKSVRASSAMKRWRPTHGRFAPSPHHSQQIVHCNWLAVLQLTKKQH